MTIEQLRALPQDLTLARCHLSRADEEYVGPACHVVKRLIGAGHLLLWSAADGPKSLVLTDERHAVRVALFTSEYGAPPPSARRSRKKTEPGLMPIAMGG